jgi:hypothetical protein
MVSALWFAAESATSSDEPFEEKGRRRRPFVFRANILSVHGRLFSKRFRFARPRQQFAPSASHASHHDIDDAFDLIFRQLPRWCHPSHIVDCLPARRG